MEFKYKRPCEYWNDIPWVRGISALLMLLEYNQIELPFTKTLEIFVEDYFQDEQIRSVSKNLPG